MKPTNIFAAAASCALVAGCVPATEQLAPAGAAGFVTDPSPASRGDPFMTDDGWTLRFEQAVLQGHAIATPMDPGDGDVSSPSDTDVFRWNARDRVEIYATALSVAPWRLSLKLHNGRSLLDAENRDNVVDRGVDPRLARRFLQAADDGNSSSYLDGAIGPVMVVVVRAEKDGHVVRLDAALSPNGATATGPGIEPALDVRANALVAVPLPVSAERLFLTSSADGQHLEFEAFARADADGDGNLTTTELQSAVVPCPTCPFDGKPGTKPTGSLLALLRSRLSTVIGGF